MPFEMVPPHAETHKRSGSDELKLHEFGEPTDSVDFSNEAAVKIKMEELPTAPSAVTAKFYFNTSSGRPYIRVP